MPKIRDRVKELRKVRAGDLIPNSKNHRRHPESQRRALRSALSEIGMAGAVLVRESRGKLHIIDGHLRQEEVDPDDTVPALILDVTAKEADKILATFDAISGLAEIDLDALGALTADIDLGEDLQSLVDSLTDDPPAPPEVVEDEIPEPPADPITKPGDVWALGDHRLKCGSSTDQGDVADLLDGAKPFLMVTDPPYGVEYDANWRNEAERADGSKIGASAVGAVENDDMADWTEAWKLSPASVCYVYHASLFTDVVKASLDGCGFEMRNLIIWAKNNFAISRGHYHHKHEPCWYGVRKGATAKWASDHSQTTLWEIDKPQKSETGHSTQKPVECMARPIRHHGDAGDIIHDPFLGSGTTLIAAEQVGRTCYGMELSPSYCDVAVQRWENLTGGKAERIEG